MLKNQKSLSIFFPVYNEEKVIDATIREALKIAGSLFEDYEILLVNDGSTDRSKEKIMEWMSCSDKIRLVDHEINLGYGATLRDGFKNAEKELIFYTDSDMPVDLNDISKIIPLIGACDIVIGYRIDRKDSPRRFIYSKIYNFLLKILLRVKARDANFSFKCIKKEMIEKFDLKAKSVFVDGELLAEIVRNKGVIREIPIAYIPRKHGRSNFDSLKAAVFTFKELLCYWITNHIFKGYK